MLFVFGFGVEGVAIPTVISRALAAVVIVYFLIQSDFELHIKRTLKHRFDFKMLRKVLANPKKYAPSGVYIVRIHGTFVNFLDLSPEIQEDIIKRLDPDSTDL